MSTEPRDPVFARSAPRSLSGRARTVLLRHQRSVSLLERDLQGADRMLAGALTACDAASQQEMLSAYLEAVQELRVGLQRLEAFLLQRLIEPDGADDAAAPDGADPVGGHPRGWVSATDAG